MYDGLLINQVAKKYKINKSTLHYYDEINLLKPYVDGENGYRYYKNEDINKLEIILILKETGLSLKEIKLFLEEPSNEKVLSLLKSQESHIEKKIRDLQKLQVNLKNKIDFLSNYKDIEIYGGIKFDDYEGTYIYRYDIKKTETLDEAYRSLEDELEKSLNLRGLVSNKFGICLDRLDFKGGNLLNYKYIFHYLLEGIESDKLYRIDKSRYIKKIHKGKLDDIDISFKEMATFLEEHGLIVSGDIFIIPLVNLWETKYEEDFLYEILISI